MTETHKPNDPDQQQSNKNKPITTQDIIDIFLEVLSDRERNKPELISIKEVSKMISFKPDWIYKRIALKKFPKPIKVDRASRWKRSQVIEWIKSLTE